MRYARVVAEYVRAVLESPLNAREKRMILVVTASPAASPPEPPRDAKVVAPVSPLDSELEALLALAQAARGLWKESLESFVTVAEKDPKRGNEDARPLMVEIFGILGPQHPLVADYRHRLSSAIY